MRHFFFLFILVRYLFRTLTLTHQNHKNFVVTGIVDAQQTLGPGIDLDEPLVIFVDGNTASAAEVFAAALKENDRATLVGQKTFGKGIVQTVRPLSNSNGGVAVTVQKYETPKHNNINKQGIPVDVEISSCEGEDAVACVPESAFRRPERE